MRLLMCCTVGTTAVSDVKCFQYMLNAPLNVYLKYVKEYSAGHKQGHSTMTASIRKFA